MKQNEMDIYAKFNMNLLCDHVTGILIPILFRVFRIMMSKTATVSSDGLMRIRVEEIDQYDVELLYSGLWFEFSVNEKSELIFTFPYMDDDVDGQVKPLDLTKFDDPTDLDDYIRNVYTLMCKTHLYGNKVYSKPKELEIQPVQDQFLKRIAHIEEVGNYTKIKYTFEDGSGHYVLISEEAPAVKIGDYGYLKDRINFEIIKPTSVH